MKIYQIHITEETQISLRYRITSYKKNMTSENKSNFAVKSPE